MSLLTTASLVVTPNAGEEGTLFSIVPNTGLGDLSVTRATTATRINSQGLVELVPYNLFTYSEQFDNADWTKVSSTITANSTTAPDGTMTADTLTITSGGYLLKQLALFPAVSGQSVTISVYAKNQITNFLLFGGATASGTDTYTITDSGNGWYRHTRTRVFTTTTSLLTLQWIIYDQVGNNFIWGAQLVEGSVAKDYQKTETRLNIPRLDYSNGTCPSILVEPQRTNLARWSSSFDNSVWTGLSFNATVTANDATAPDGTMTADKVVFGTGGYLYQEFVVSGLASATISIYSKTSTQQIVFGGATPAGTDVYSYVDVGNGWYRQLITRTFTSGGTGVIQFLPFGSNQTLYFWGAQLELGSYATSYIPTTSAGVTRNADVISKTGISSLIGQTEGVIFYDFILSTTGVDFTLGNLYSSSNGNSYSLLYINPSNQIGASLTDNGITQCEIVVPTLSLGRHKIAFAYKANDFAVYVDGQLIGTDTSGSVPNMDSFNMVDFNLAPNAYRQEVNIYASALWKQRLSNTQLAQLTTL